MITNMLHILGTLSHAPFAIVLFVLFAGAVAVTKWLEGGVDE